MKQLNGEAFDQLKKLEFVGLESKNSCINENFDGASRVAVLRQTVDSKCEYVEITLIQLEAKIKSLEDMDNESKPKNRKLSNENFVLNRQLQSEIGEKNDAIVKMEKFKSSLEICEKKKPEQTLEKAEEPEIPEKANKCATFEIENAFLSEENTELKSDTKWCNKQLKSINDLQKKLEKKWKEACVDEGAAKLREDYQHQKEENESVIAAYDNIRAEIVQEQERNAKLEKKLKSFNEYTRK